MNIYSQRTFDAALLLRAAGAAITATEIGALILDLGNGLVEGDLIVDVTALDTSSADESYALILEGSPDANFGTAANIKVLAELRIGASAATAPNGAPDVPGRYCINCRNERNGVTYRYARLRTVIAGTTPSITHSAFLAKD